MTSKFHLNLPRTAFPLRVNSAQHELKIQKVLRYYANYLQTKFVNSNEKSSEKHPRAIALHPLESYTCMCAYTQYCMHSAYTTYAHCMLRR